MGSLAFLERAGRSPGLEGSSYGRLLAHHAGDEEPAYPGSPRIAMELRGDAAGRFVFCDLDGGSLSNIAEDARLRDARGPRAAGAGGRRPTLGGEIQ